MEKTTAVPLSNLDLFQPGDIALFTRMPGYKSPVDNSMVKILSEVKVLPSASDTLDPKRHDAESWGVHYVLVELYPDNNTLKKLHVQALPVPVCFLIPITRAIYPL